MKCVVAMKQIPDLQQVRIKDKKPVFAGVPQTFGDIDKSALETAVQIVEEFGGKTVVVAVGTEELEDVAKEAMAAGGDESVLVADDATAELESYDTASIIAELVSKMEDVDLVFFAEGSGDNYSGQVGSIVAELLGYPQVGFAKSVEIADGKATVVRALEEGDETVEVQLPAVIMVSSGINKPRIPSVMQVLKAGKKPKEVLDLDDLDYQPSGAKIAMLENLAPDTARKQQPIKGADELVEIIREQLK